MDPLSEVLRSVRLTGGIFLDASFSAPWSVLSQVSPEDCAPRLPAPRQLIAYHLTLKGGFLLSVEGEPPVEVRAGEIVLLPRNEVHVMASAPGLRPIKPDKLIAAGEEGALARLVMGGGGEATHVVCGYLASEDQFNPLIASLPRILKVDIRSCASHDWIEASMRFAARELAQGRLASSNVMARLSELLLVEAVRNYSADIAEHDAGWLRGLSDSQIGRALALLHGDMGKAWTVQELAREVGLSRTAFIDRFTALVGTPPIRYLTSWRLQSAKLQLRETTKSIAQLAYAVGYESEEAFSRAFKREFGLPPATWRNRAQASQ
jgi:AraC-like DNA-binding protein